MSNIPNCNNATYIGTMLESNNDQLSVGDTLVSSNCEYSLRAEVGRISLYSLSQETILSSWYVHDTIWSIKTHNNPQTLILSNIGCLSWSIAINNINASTSNIILMQYCDPHPNGTGTGNYNESMSMASTLNLLSNEQILNVNVNQHASKDNISIMLLPLSICIVSVLLGLIFLVTLFRKSNLFRIMTTSANAAKPTNTDTNNNNNNNTNIKVDIVDNTKNKKNITKQTKIAKISITASYVSDKSDDADDEDVVYNI